MPRRRHILATVGLSASALVLAGCAADAVEVQAPTPDRRDAARCSSLVDALPEAVLDESSRPISPESATAAAWGDPAIILRCGVDRPSALQANSECLVVNKVGWFAEKAERGYVFTTIGRSTYVEVSVPSEYAPESNALVDVASAVRAHVPEVKPCQ